MSVINRIEERQILRATECEDHTHVSLRVSRGRPVYGTQNALATSGFCGSQRGERKARFSCAVVEQNKKRVGTGPIWLPESRLLLPRGFSSTTGSVPYEQTEEMDDRFL